MIEKASSPDKDVRSVTRAELARLNELEVQARASVKMLEKELAEMDLKLMGAAERERIARERGDANAAASAANDMVALSSHRDFLKQQIQEANSSAARARALREERSRQGTDLANETYLTEMRENIAGVQSSFDVNDPASTIDEMRAKLQSRGGDTTAARVAQADHEMETERARKQAEDLLAQYKAKLADEAQRTSVVPPPQPSSAVESSSGPSSRLTEDDGPEEKKTLGPGSGNIRPID
jgi:hypothetical protein